MNMALNALYALQQLDSSIALTLKHYQALDPGSAEESAVESSCTMLERLKREAQTTQGDLLDAELELATVEKKKKDDEARLYGGRITVPKEMTATEEEITALGRRREALDEKILVLMDQLETRQKDVRDAEKIFKDAEKALIAAQAEFKKSSRALKLRTKQLQAERDAHAMTTDPTLLKKYEAIRKPRSGVGIASIDDGICGACRMALPTIIINQVSDTELVLTCGNCGRMLCVLP